MTGGEELRVVLRLEKVSCAVRQERWTDPLDFTLHLGEAAAVVGPTGGGRRRLLRVAAGLMAPDRGKVAHRAERVAYVFRAGGLLSSSTALENIVLPLVVQGAPEPEARERAAAEMERFGVGAVGELAAQDLSPEASRLIQYARAAALDPELLLIEQPMLSLGREEEAVTAWLKEQLADGRMGLLLTTTAIAVARKLDAALLPFRLGSGLHQTSFHTSLHRGAP